MEHKEVARRVSCVSTQVSKHVDKYARHLKKRTFEHYERRAAEEVEASDKKIKKLIRENMNIRDTEICEGLATFKFEVQRLLNFYKKLLEVSSSQEIFWGSYYNLKYSHQNLPL